MSLTAPNIGESAIFNGELRFYEPQTEKRLLSHKEIEQARQQAEQAQLDAIPRLLNLGLGVAQIIGVNLA